MSSLSPSRTFTTRPRKVEAVRWDGVYDGPFHQLLARWAFEWVTRLCEDTILDVEDAEDDPRGHLGVQVSSSLGGETRTPILYSSADDDVGVALATGDYVVRHPDRSLEVLDVETFEGRYMAAPPGPLAVIHSLWIVVDVRDGCLSCTATDEEGPQPALDLVAAEMAESRAEDGMPPTSDADLAAQVAVRVTLVGPTAQAVAAAVVGLTGCESIDDVAELAAELEARRG